MELKNHIVHGVKWGIISKIFLLIISILQLLLVVNLIGPEAYGTMAILSVIMTFSTLFIDMGFSKIIIHKQDSLSDIQLNTLYWSNILLALIIYLTIFILSGLIQSFYSEYENLDFYICVVSLSFIISSFGIQYNTLLQKEFKFKEMEIIIFLGAFSSFIVSYSMALMGYGVLSLITANLVSSFIIAFFSFLYGRKLHSIKFEYNISSIKDLFSFGIYYFLAKVTGTFIGAIDTILIGKFFSPEVLGIYNIAKQVITKVTGQFTPLVQKILYPSFAKIQKENLKMENLFKKTIEISSFIIILLCTYLFVFVDDIFVLFFDNKWHEAIVIVKALMFGIALNSIGSSSGSLILAVGKVKLNFYWALFRLLFMFIFIYFASMTLSIEIVAIISSLVIIFFTLIGKKYVLDKIFKITYLEYFKPILSYLSVSIFIVLILQLIEIDNQYFRFFFDFFAISIIYFGVAYFFKLNALQYLILGFKIKDDNVR